MPPNPPLPRLLTGKLLVKTPNNGNQGLFWIFLRKSYIKRNVRLPKTPAIHLYIAPPHFDTPPAPESGRCIDFMCNKSLRRYDCFCFSKTFCSIIEKPFFLKSIPALIRLFKKRYVIWTIPPKIGDGQHPTPTYCSVPYLFIVKYIPAWRRINILKALLY